MPKRFALSAGVFVLAAALGLAATELLLRASGVAPMGVSAKIRWMFKETSGGVILTTPARPFPASDCHWPPTAA